jgi:replicative DNA helicase
MQSTPSNTPNKPNQLNTNPSSIILDKVIKSLSERKDKPQYPTGIYELDELTWGFHKKELYIFASRPSQGKTSLSLQSAWNASDIGASVVFNSLEMSEENIIERLTCNQFKINGWKLRKGFKDEIDKFIKCSEQMRARLTKNSFEVIDKHGKNIGETEEILKQYQPDIMVIDHAQKISQKGFSSKYEALADFVNRVQDLAIKYDVAIVLNSQINRGGENLKGAGELEEAADTLLFCNWVCKGDNEHEDKLEYRIEVMKQRSGACDTAIINFDATTFSFSSRASDPNRLMRVIK